jgi:hypothetical protein
MIKRLMFFCAKTIIIIAGASGFVGGFFIEREAG